MVREIESDIVELEVGTSEFKCFAINGDDDYSWINSEVDFL